MPISEDAWLSVRFGHPVYTVDAATTTAELSEHCASQALASYQAKVNTRDVALVKRLIRGGLYVVDANVLLTRRPPPSGQAPSVPVVTAEPEHEQAVLEIAATAFHASRFHLDPAVPSAVANRIKRDWVESYFRGTRGDELLVALDGERPVGFLAAASGVDEGRALCVIDLIATERGRQGAGIGAGLTAEFLARSLGRCDLVQVGSQLANVGATRFYERVGFVTSQTRYVLHGHVGAGGDGAATEAT